MVDIVSSQRLSRVANMFSIVTGPPHGRLVLRTGLCNMEVQSLQCLLTTARVAAGHGAHLELSDLIDSVPVMLCIELAVSFMVRH